MNPHPRIAMKSSQSGFSLIELMIAVSIVAILASVAIVGLRFQAQKARTTQATSFLGAMGAAQAGRDPYVGSGATAAAWCPTTVGAGVRDWDPTCEPAMWARLGVSVPNQTYFQYSMLAGTAAESCGAGPTICGSVTPGDRWWVAVARGDLDGDGVFSTFITSYSTGGSFIEVDPAE